MCSKIELHSRINYINLPLTLGIRPPFFKKVFP
jgi:hypothetical protein